MPLYNEQETVAEITEKVLALPLELELIIIDNASTDNTGQIIAQFASRNNVKIIKREHNIGKGDAVVAGLEFATGKYTIIQDGDLEYDPNDIVKMVNSAEEKNAKAMFGSRILNQGSGISYYRYLWGGKLLTLIARLLFFNGITDESTCYKMVTTDLMKGLKLECKRFEFCPELVAKLGRNNIKIHEIPIAYYPRKFEDGK
ncbi:MAG: glycosyltransferase family 2 protein, partial [candidate division Zixibacteria bacterium]|nr:glycosyltransferase family 2 protein [candidate division Zixibacteria bacterium]